MQPKNNFATFRAPPVAPTAGPVSSAATTAGRRHTMVTTELYSYGGYKSWVQKIRDEWRSSK
jgi:hypothetical protein